MLLRKRCDGEKAGNQRKIKSSIRRCGCCFFADFGSVLFAILGIIVIRITLGGDIDHGLVCLRPDRVGDGEKLLVL